MNVKIELDLLVLLHNFNSYEKSSTNVFVGDAACRILLRFNVGMYLNQNQLLASSFSGGDG